MACEHNVEALAKKATEFVVTKKGTWGHEDWENFCAQAALLGFELNEYNRIAIGNLLEALRYFYQLNPTPVAIAKQKVAPVKKAPAQKSPVK